jgi:hypothetical protein
MTTYTRDTHLDTAPDGTTPPVWHASDYAGYVDPRHTFTKDSYHGAGLDHVFDIYSIGDAEMLHNAFQGVAMVFNAASMTGMVKTGLVIGLLLVGVRYLVNMQFTAHQMVAALIAFSVLFTVKAKVSIEDAYTGQVRQVANIPVGVAAPMSVVSNIGYDLTRMFETAFSTPDEAQLFRHGYGDALKTLLKLRGVGSTSAFSDAGLNGDVGASLNNYIDGRVRFDLELPYGPHEVTRESLLKAPDLWAAMKTTFINKDVIVYLPNVVTNGDPHGKQLSCEKAYVALADYLATGEFKALWDAYMKGRPGIKDANEKAGDRVAAALAALNVTATDAQTYMLNALMASLLRDGPAAVIERTAMEQLQMQWSGEQGVFNQVARPMMAFVETFTVAASPLAAVLVTLGPLGMGLAARYLLLVAWVSLWGPVMAVCNLYITIAATHALDALSASAGANGSGIAAMVAQDELFQALDTWVATGGMLAASVPAITLMLIYGGAVTATNLAGKMTAGATSSVQQPSKALAPDPINVPATVQGAAQFTANPNVGSARYGVQQPTYSVGSSAEKSVQSAYTGLRSASAQVMNTQSQMVQTASRQGHSVRDGSTVTDLLSNSSSSADRYAAGVGRQIADQVGSTETEKRAISSAMATNVGAALGTKGLLGLVSPVQMEAGVQASLNASGATDAARTKQLSEAATNAWNQEHMNSSEFRKAHDYATQHAEESVFSTESMQAHARQYQSQLSRVKSAQDQYTEAAAQRDTASHVGSVDYNNLASRLVKSGQYVDLSNYDRDVRQSGDAAKIQDWQQRLDRADRQIDYAGYMNYGVGREALQRFMALDSKDSAAAVKIATEALMPATGGHVDTALTAGSNADLKTPVEGIYGSQEARGDQGRTGETRDTLGLDGNSNATPVPAGNPDRNSGGASSAPRSETAPSNRPKARLTGEWSSDDATRMSQIRGYLQERKGLTEKFPPPKSGAGAKQGTSDMPGEDTSSSPVKRLNIPQADAVRKQIEGTNLEKRAKDSYRDVDNSGMVGTALKRTDTYATMRESAKQAKSLLPSRSKNAYFESYKISAKPREIKACGILQSGRFMSEKGVVDDFHGDSKADLSSKPPIRENGKWNDFPDVPNPSKK